MEELERKQERKFFISVIVLLIATYFAVVSGLESEAYDNFQLYKNMHGEFLDKEAELKKCDDWVNFLEKAPDNIVIATVYQNTVEQTNSDNYHTASNFKLDSLDQYQHRIIAVSRDLLKEYPLGTKVLVQGNEFYTGIWTVRDKMNERYTDRIDFLINDGMQEIEQAVTLKKIKK